MSGSGLLSGGGVGDGGFKIDDGFVGPGVAEFFAGEALDGFGVVAKDVDLVGQIGGNHFLGLDFGVQLQDLPAHPLIFINEGLVTHEDQQEDGNHHQTDRNLRQFAPDAQVNTHGASKAQAGCRGEGICVFRRGKFAVGADGCRRQNEE